MRNLRTFIIQGAAILVATLTFTLTGGAAPAGLTYAIKGAKIVTVSGAVIDNGSIVMRDGVIQQVSDGKTVYDEPDTPFVASFVGETNAFSGTVLSATKDSAVVETAFGPLRGRNPKGVKAGDKAILFVRPESLKPGQHEADTTFTSQVNNVAFEGNVTHVYLKGVGKKEITLTVGRHGAVKIPEQGKSTAIGYDAALGLVLPDGKMARE